MNKESTTRQDPGHVSVLLQETILGLDIKPGDVVVDGTLGSGGHTEAIMQRFGRGVKMICLDMDEEAIERSQKRLSTFDGDLTFVQENFRHLDRVLTSLSIPKVNKILLDIGLSSNQLNQSGRGFTFTKDEPLRMTFKKTIEEDEISAATIVNEWQEETLETIIRGYGEERYAKRIARGIAEARKIKPFQTTNELVATILEATPKSYHHGHIHPATRTFQALRIAANDELEALKEGVWKGFDALASDGRMAVISFHSLEDRIVKRFFREKAGEDQGELITKRPIIPTEAEVVANPRSRSAKLRILRKL